MAKKDRRFRQNIDTGCVFGGKLTALRYPEKELVSVPAARVYYEPANHWRGLCSLKNSPGQPRPDLLTFLTSTTCLGNVS